MPSSLMANIHHDGRFGYGVSTSAVRDTYIDHILY